MPFRTKLFIFCHRVKSNIVGEINASPFYSVIMDTSQDVAKRDHLSQVFRYVAIDRDEMGIATDIRVVEAFLGFQETVSSSASALEDRIMGCLDQNGLDLSRCRGQGYDGAANMSGVYSGVQARIAERELHSFTMWSKHYTTSLPTVLRDGHYLAAC